MKIATSLKRALSRRWKSAPKEQPRAESKSDTLVIVRNLEDGSRLVQVHLKDAGTLRNNAHKSNDRFNRRLPTVEEEADQITPVLSRSQRDSSVPHINKKILKSPSILRLSSRLPSQPSTLQDVPPRITISPSTPPSPRTPIRQDVAEAASEFDTDITSSVVSETIAKSRPGNEVEPTPEPTSQTQPVLESEPPPTVSSSVQLHKYRPKLRPQPHLGWERKRQDVIAHLAQANLLLDQMEQEDSYSNLIRIFTSELFGEEYKEVEGIYRELPEFKNLRNSEEGDQRETQRRSSWSSTISSMYRVGFEAAGDSSEGHGVEDSDVRASLAMYQWRPKPVTYEGT